MSSTASTVTRSNARLDTVLPGLPGRLRDPQRLAPQRSRRLLLEPPQRRRYASASNHAPRSSPRVGPSLTARGLSNQPNRRSDASLARTTLRSGSRARMSYVRDRRLCGHAHHADRQHRSETRLRDGPCSEVRCPPVRATSVVGQLAAALLQWTSSGVRRDARPNFNAAIASRQEEQRGSPSAGHSSQAKAAASGVRLGRSGAHGPDRAMGCPPQRVALPSPPTSDPPG